LQIREKEHRPARAAGFQFAGRRGFQIHAEVMQPSRPGKTGLHRHIQNTPAVAEQFLRVREREELEKILGRDAREQAMKMKPAQARAFRQSRQIRLIDVAFIQKPDDSSDAFIIIHVPSLP
jgi:hypothetical protein